VDGRRGPAPGRCGASTCWVLILDTVKDGGARQDWSSDGSNAEGQGGTRCGLASRPIIFPRLAPDRRGYAREHSASWAWTRARSKSRRHQAQRQQEVFSRGPGRKRHRGYWMRRCCAAPRDAPVMRGQTQHGIEPVQRHEGMIQSPAELSGRPARDWAARQPSPRARAPRRSC